MENVIIFDFETTGLYHIRDRIVEIGAIEFDDKGNIVKTYETLLNPGIIIPDEVIKIHGINNEMVKDAIDYESGMKEFLDFIGNKALVAHNACFDAGFISVFCLKNKIDFPTNLIYDSLFISRNVFKEFKSHSLVNLAKSLDIPYYNKHRSLPDVEVTAKIFFIALRKKFGNDLSIVSSDKLSSTFKPFKFENYSLNSKIDDDKTVSTIKTALKNKQNLKIIYKNSRQETLNRVITPKQLISNGRSVFLYAFCQFRNDDRNFLIDRIQNIELI